MKKVLLSVLLTLVASIAINAKNIYKLSLAGDPLTFEQAKAATGGVALVQNGYVLCNTGDGLRVIKIDDMDGTMAWQIKFEEGAGDLASSYNLHVYNGDASVGYVNASVWSHSYITSSASGEKTNGANWTIAETSENKYSIRNLGATQGSYNTYNEDGTTKNDYTSKGYLTAQLSGYWANHATWQNEEASNWQFYQIESKLVAKTSFTFSKVDLATALTTEKPVVMMNDAEKVVNGTWGTWNDGVQVHDQSDFDEKNYQLKIESIAIDGAENTYTIKLNENGNYNRYLQASMWGHSFFNSNLKDQNGNDGKNCAIWTIAALEDGKYSLRSLGIEQGAIRGSNADGYLCVGGDGSVKIDSKTAVAWSFYTIDEVKEIPVGDEEPEEPAWTCPEGETDVTTLEWVKKTQDCADNLGKSTGDTVYGTDSKETPISYFDVTNYGNIKVYGPAGQTVRFFINREEYPDNFQFFADINENGEGVLELLSVYTSQKCEYVHLNGLKASSWGQSVQVDHITAFGTPEKPWVCPEGEIDYTTLEGYKDVNNIGKKLNGGAVVYGNQSSGDDYTDVTAYETVKFYGTPGATLRIFANRAGGESVTVGKNEQRVAIGEDGVGTLNVKDVMTATEKEYCYLSGIKICATWQGASVDQNVVINGITVVSASATPVTYTIETEAGKIGTIVLDYTASIEGATLYEVASFDASKGLELSEVEGDMEGGTPYIYVASADEVVCTKKGSSVAHSSVDCTMDGIGNGLVGCYSPFQYMFAITNCYIIYNNQLRQIAQGNVTVPANRCFFDPDKCTNKPADAKTITIPTAEATAIKNVNASLEGGKIYDMNGREVKSMKKGGIYVVGGMKISVK